jgi:hypothetical protein
MKALYFLKWPLVLLLCGVLIFRVGAFLRMKDSAVSLPFVILGYAMILAAIIWIILKISFFKNPEDDSN